jgi:hypothetical protein
VIPTWSEVSLARMRLERSVQRDCSAVQPLTADELIVIDFPHPRVPAAIAAGDALPPVATVATAPAATETRHAVRPPASTWMRHVPGSAQLPVVESHHHRMRPESPSWTLKGGVHPVFPDWSRWMMMAPWLKGLWSYPARGIETAALHASSNTSM